jgi:hypothetical protein
MKDLIEALQIFDKYIVPGTASERFPTNCEHDVLCVCVATREDISEEDVARLSELGFDWNDEYDAWSSFRFGSC